MSYLVLARKWRPTVFAEVVGQDHVTTTLRKAFEKGRLAHAYLFSGPRGCGKTTTARLLAKIINCENPSGGEPCNECSSCVAVNEGTHLDMIEIDGASNRGIDEIRELREKIGYAPSQSKSKIYIIDEVHMLTQQAFNALLKTLEEPPDHVYLVFATTEPHKVPATILSRCQRFNFKRLELAELSGQLEKICRAEGIDFDPEALVLVCRRADGSMRDAESLLDQCISAAEGRIDLATVRGVLGLVDSQVVSRLLDAVSRRDREKALEVVDDVTSSGMDLEEFFVAFLEGIRNLLVISVAAGRTEWLDLTAGEIDELSSIAGRFRVEDLLFIFRSMSRALRELRGAGNPRYHVEAAVAEAASWESAVDIGELIGRLESVGGAGPAAGGSERGSGGGAESGGDRAGGAAESGEDAMEARPAVDGETGGGGGEKVEQPVRENPLLAHLGGREEWERFLAKVRESKLTVGIYLMSAEVAGIEDGKLLLSFSSKDRFAMEMIREQKNRRLVESHLEKFYGRKFTVETCEMVDVGSGKSDRQAEMVLEARTRPGGAVAKGRGRGGRTPRGRDSGNAAGEGGREEKPGRRARKDGGSPETGNPVLERLMEGLDAELLE